MYAVVEIGGHQYRVSENDTLFVDHINDAEEEISFDNVLLFNDGEGNIEVGTPVVDGVSVDAKILDKKVKADKVMVFKKKRRKGYQVKRGHRQLKSQIQIEKINN